MEKDKDVATEKIVEKDKDAAAENIVEKEKDAAKENIMVKEQFKKYNGKNTLVNKDKCLMKKCRDLIIILCIYIVAYMAGWFSCANVNDVIYKFFVFDVVATIAVFVFSTLLHNSSVYDAYWSLTPLVMIIWLYISMDVKGIYQILFLVAFCIWAIRLTINWCVVFSDFGYEDWRYKKYRDESSRLIWPIINFFGIHMMPTIVVFAGMLPVFVIAKENIDFWSVIGVIILLFGVSLEIIADKQMHDFLKTTTSKTACNKGIWKYSRHPNYLGEITVWIGVYITMLLCHIDYWYYGIGALAIVVLFNTVSIPLMEKRQINRRPDYELYKSTTSRLLLRKPKR